MHLQYMVGLRHSSAHHLSAFVPGEHYTVKYDIVVEMHEGRLLLFLNDLYNVVNRFVVTYNFHKVDPGH